jgi:hypothetical protein
MIDQKIQPMGIQDFFELANRIACIEPLIASSIRTPHRSRKNRDSQSDGWNQTQSVQNSCVGPLFCAFMFEGLATG